jgi:hypothetical protein
MLIAGAKDNKKVTKPIFIVGAPRSGTTPHVKWENMWKEKKNSLVP